MPFMLGVGLLLGMPSALQPAPLLASQAVSGRQVSLDVKDADLHNVLRLLARVGQVNMVVSDRVVGKVTLRLTKVPWEQALQVVLITHNLGVERVGDILRVDTLDSLKQRAVDAAALLAVQEQATPLETIILPLSYARAEELKGTLQPFLSPRGSMMVDSRTNSLLITDVPDSLARLRRLVEGAGK